jgi:hypothetical protein
MPKFKPGDIIVPKEHLEDWQTYGLEVESHDREALRASPLGGGWVYRFPPARIAFHSFVKVQKRLLENPSWHQSYFYAEWLDKKYRGWTTGDRWNGWATPYFEMNEARRYAADSLTADMVIPMHYDPVKDAFIGINPDYPDDPEVYKGALIDLHGRKLKLYPIGAYVWTWEEERGVGNLDWYPEEERD